jgi:hypothetical protein
MRITAGAEVSLERLRLDWRSAHNFLVDVLNNNVEFCECPWVGDSELGRQCAFSCKGGFVSMSRGVSLDSILLHVAPYTSVGHRISAAGSLEFVKSAPLLVEYRGLWWVGWLSGKCKVRAQASERN